MLYMKFNGCPKNIHKEKQVPVGKPFKLDEKIGF